MRTPLDAKNNAHPCPPHISLTADYMVDPQGHLWLADMGSHIVMQFTPEGRLLKTLGTPGEPGCDRVHFDRPTDVAVSPDAEVFVTDGYGNNRVVHFDKDGRFVNQWGKLGTGPGELHLPHAVAIDSQGRLYVASRSGGHIQVFDQTGKLLDQWPDLPVPPWDLWVSTEDEIWMCGLSLADGTMYVEGKRSQVKTQMFVKYDPSGRPLGLQDVPISDDDAATPGKVNVVHAIAVDSKGNICAAEIWGKRVQKLSVFKPPSYQSQQQPHCPPARFHFGEDYFRRSIGEEHLG